MLSKTEVWNEVARVVNEHGYALFDLEYPNGSHGVLRVYLCQLDGSAKGIDLGVCARVAKSITNLPTVDLLIPGEATLEVSSPGLNRKLSRPEHFKGAVGERIRLTVARSTESGQKKEGVRGKLLSFDGQSVEIEKDDKSNKGESLGVERISLSLIQEARVDFVFGKSDH